MSFISSL